MVDSVEFKFQMKGRYSKKKHEELLRKIVDLHSSFSDINEHWIEYDAKDKQLSIGLNTDVFPMEDFVRDGLKILISESADNCYFDSNPDYANSDGELYAAIRQDYLNYYQSLEEMQDDLKPKKRIVETEFYDFVDGESSILIRMRIKGKRKSAEVFDFFDRFKKDVFVDSAGAMLRFKNELDNRLNNSREAFSDFPDWVRDNGNLCKGTSDFLKDICFLEQDDKFLFVGFSGSGLASVDMSALNETMYLLWWGLCEKIWCKFRNKNKPKEEELMVEVEDLWTVWRERKADDRW